MFPPTSTLRTAAALALMGGYAIAGTAAATADPGTANQADINTLAGSLSRGYDINNCQPAPLSGAVLAELDCGQSPDAGGPANGIYQLFANGADLAAAFTAGNTGVSLSPCGENGDSPGTWQHGHGQPGGQIACGTYKEAAVITWTTDAKNVLSHVRASNTDVNALFQWWRTNG